MLSLRRGVVPVVDISLINSLFSERKSWVVIVLLLLVTCNLERHRYSLSSSDVGTLSVEKTEDRV